MSLIKKFTILGERCSGTNYLEELILNNFNIDITWEYGFKHFFGFYKFRQNEDAIKNEDEVLFIGIVRHPIYWINSLFKEQHNLPNHFRNINNFLFNEFYSFYDNVYSIRTEDLNYITNKRYKNIFEMRFLKNYYLINSMPNNVKNYILINYENLRDNTNDILSIIENKFSLVRKYSFYKNVKYYKKEKHISFNKKKLELPLKYQIICSLKLNKQQEKKLGYNIELK